MDNSKPIVCICWYETAEQWQAIRDICVDPANWDDSYNDWKNTVREVMTLVLEEGSKAVRVPMDPANVQQWCSEKGVQCDTHARTDYAIAMGKRMSHNG